MPLSPEQSRELRTNPGLLSDSTVEAAALLEANRKLVDKITGRFDACDKGVHARARQKWEHYWALYRNYTDLKESVATDRRDRDMGLRQAQREWGEQLFIPYSFSTVESVLPRMLSNSPKVLVKPRAQAWEQNAPHMKSIIDSQLAAIDYELILQAIARHGLIYGLGVQKVYWNRKTREGKKLAPATLDSSKWTAQSATATLMDDPMIECVDPFDFFWDPAAGNVQDCEWVIHRTWRSVDYIRRRMLAQEWTGVRPEDLERGTGGTGKYEEAWGQRMRVNGYSNFKAAPIHEVWEYHDRERVITVLDREWVVQNGENPAWHGELPFQAFRPTPIAGRFAGIGEIEPMEDLQHEMNNLRSNRADNARIAIERSFFFTEGMIDPADFKMGPGLGIPVLGNPGEVIQPVPISDIPNSGYQEENTLRADIERVTGLDDTASGGSSNTTATGTQLTQAMANLRIQMKTRVCEVELVRGAGRQVLALNQQRILTARDVRIPSAPSPGEPDRRWAWKQVGPAELQGEFELEVEGGSMAPENVPQQRADAQAMLQLMGANEDIVRPEALKFALRNMGINDPELLIRPEQPKPTVDPDALGQALEAAGVSKDLYMQAVAAVTQPPEQNHG